MPQLRSWWDFEIAPPTGKRPPAHVATTWPISAQFAGASSLQATALTPHAFQAIAKFAGASSWAAAADTFKFQQATVSFSGTGTWSADTRKGLAATATFPGNSIFSLPNAQKIEMAVASFSGGTALQYVDPLLWHRWSAQFLPTGSSTLSVDSFIRGRQYGSAQIGGTSAMSITNVRARLRANSSLSGAGALSATPYVKVRWQASAAFAGASAISITNVRARMRTSMPLVGAGSFLATPDIVHPTSLAPNAPVLTLNSAADDTTPDFFVDLPTGAGNQTDAAAGDTLTIQYSADSGSTWNTYLTHVLVNADLTGATMSGTATALTSGTYQFRAKLTRSSLDSSWSATVSDTVVVAPSAPSIILLSGPTDQTPDFSVTYGSDILSGDIFALNYSSDAGTTWSLYSGATFQANGGGTFTCSGAVLQPGDYQFRANIQRSTVYSPWSNLISETIRVGNTNPSAMYLRATADKSETGTPDNVRLRSMTDKG